jgi:hypothetical protein
MVPGTLTSRRRSGLAFVAGRRHHRGLWPLGPVWAIRATRGSVGLPGAGLVEVPLSHPAIYRDPLGSEGLTWDPFRWARPAWDPLRSA